MSCVSTSTSTYSPQPASVIIPLFSAYSAVNQTVTGTFNGTASSITASYNVLYVSSTTYKVDLAYKTSSVSGIATLWLLKDGTVEALNLAGHNITQDASMYFQLYFSLWETELVYEQLITTSTAYSYFHSTGTSTVTVGPTTFAVTTYTANTTPETIQSCNGDSLTLASGSFSVGTASGSNYPLIISINIAGSETTSGVSSTISFVSQINSASVA